MHPGASNATTVNTQPGNAVSVRKLKAQSASIVEKKATLAVCKVCKAIPVIRKPSTRQPGKSYAQAAADKNKKEKKTAEKEIENNAAKITDLAGLKDSLRVLKEVKMLLRE
ncbi:hypothetical protein AVEN_69993-1 [Araneus ventricosus]|uniref:Uncharacterized protein n=1 Tax=Araneus ventricosus TaxID=182803 RepID=A0A4Y2KPQ5_ARAVE|nr:hypothetical protein AVEN_69993-1 [Araneus ventricosus]